MKKNSGINNIIIDMGIDITDLKQAVTNQHEYLSGFKKTGTKVFGYFCTYAPEEIILAAGYHPVRLFESTAEEALSQAHLQSYSCSIVKSAMNSLLNGSLSYLDGVVFPHSCDTFQRLSDLFRLNASFSFFSDILLPVKTNTEAARDYTKDVFLKFKTELAKFRGADVSDAELLQAIKLTNRIKSKLLKIHELSSENPAIFEPGGLNIITRASMMMDRNYIDKRLTDIISSAEKIPPEDQDRNRVLVTGSFCSNTDIYELLHDSDADVVWEDYCSGSRYFSVQISEQGNPLNAIAERYYKINICPSKHASLSSRAEEIIGYVKKYKAEGVILFFHKFCDPHFFDYPYLKKGLEAEGIKTLLIESEGLRGSGQLRTRIETFIHML